MIGLHPVHRELAKIVHMNLDLKGDLIIGNIELQLILKLLRKNYNLVYKLDALKEIALHAYEMGDMEWEHELCRQIEELETQLV